MNNLIFDIETTPDDLPEELLPECKLGNLKDPEKIKVKQEEFKQGMIKDMSVSPYMCKIVSYQAWSYKEDKFVDVPSDNERDIIECIWDDFGGHDMLIGHNILNFDLRVILFRTMFHGLTSSRKLPLKKYQVYPIYDTMEIMAGWNSSQWKGLNWLAQRLGVGQKENDSCRVYEWHQAGEIEKIHEHCRNDVLLNKAVYEKMMGYYV